MGRANAPGLFTEAEDDGKVLFIFDLNSITSDKYLNGQPLPLDIFTQLVDVFKEAEIGPNTFKYVAKENLIICDNERLTVDYMNSLKEKVKAENRPLFIEESYHFKDFIKHTDIVNSEIEFIDKYNIDESLFCSTFVDYDTKTIIVKSRSGSIQKTISLYASKLIESCVYISDGKNRVTSLLVKYPYRELIRDLYTTDFVSRTVPISLPKEAEVKVDYADVYANRNKYYHPSPEDKVVASSIETIVKEDFSKVEDVGYIEIIDSITEKQLEEFIKDPESFNEPLVAPKILDFNPINYNQSEAAHKVAEALINESNRVNNTYNISDFSPPLAVNLYDKDKEIVEFLTELPQSVEEMLDETKAYHALEKIRAAKAKDNSNNETVSYLEKEPPLYQNYRANMPG